MAKITFQDEQGQNLNRYKMTPVEGQTDTYDLEREANITQQGTPINAENMNHMAQDEDVAELAGPNRTTETVKGNADNISALQSNKADKTEIPAQLPNPSALTISQGYGGTTGTYNGSAAKSISIPRITLHTAAPGTVADGELWGVY